MENGLWVVVVKSSLDKLGDDQNLYRSCFKLNSFSWFLWNEMWTFLTSNFFLLTLSTQDPILNRSFVNQSFILFALISSFFLFFLQCKIQNSWQKKKRWRRRSQRCHTSTAPSQALRKHLNNLLQVVFKAMLPTLSAGLISLKTTNQM